MNLQGLAQPPAWLPWCLPLWCCRVMSDEPNKGEEGAETEDDVFLKKIETSMLSQVALQARERAGGRQ